MIDRELVIAAYRLLLGREPEDEAAVLAHSGVHTGIDSLRTAFFSSDEFFGVLRKTVPQYVVVPSSLGNCLSIETDADHQQIEAIWAHIKRAWTDLGTNEPYWSVLTDESFKRERFDANAERYSESGRVDVQTFITALDRNGVDPGTLRTCIEFGGGTGRITRWLAERFATVIHCDVSNAHQKLAAEHLTSVGCNNVTFIPVDSVARLDHLPGVDAVYSIIVLQHNPPPVIKYILGKLLHVIRPGGIAYLQIPTYARGYSFSVGEYLKTELNSSDMEGHVLPQRSVFEVVSAESCRVLEVQVDNCIGQSGWISNTFLIQRPR